MSSEQLLLRQESCTRGELYAYYKKINPDLAAAFAGRKYSAYQETQTFVACLPIAGILSAIVFTAMLAGVTNGFGPVSDPSFYIVVPSAMYGVSFGIGVLPGSIAFAVLESKKRSSLKENLDRKQIEDIRDSAAEKIPLTQIEN